MDILFELLFELLFEGSVEASKSSKVPKPIRYILILLISLVFIFIIGFLLVVGITGLKKNLAAGLVLIVFGISMLILSYLKFRKIYLEKSEKDR